MRFERRRRLTGSAWTKRKEAAYLQRHKRVARRIERDVPLFADQYAPKPDTDVEAEKARRDRRATDGEQTMRDLDAKHWRKGRSAYFACEPEMRARITEEWNRWRGPLRATYFIYIVEKHNGEAERRRQYYDEQRRELAPAQAIPASLTSLLASHRSDSALAARGVQARHEARTVDNPVPLVRRPVPRP